MKNRFYLLALFFTCFSFLSLGQSFASDMIIEENLENNEPSIPEGIIPTECPLMKQLPDGIMPLDEFFVFNSDAEYEDYLGVFDWEGDDLLVQGYYPNKGRMIIQKYSYLDENEEWVYVDDYYHVYGLVKNIWLYGYFMNGVLLIPDQLLFHDERYGDVYFYNFYLGNYSRFDDNGKLVSEHVIKRNLSNPFYFEFNENGKLVSYRIDQELYDNFYYADPELMQFVRVGSVAVPDYDSNSFFWMNSWIKGTRLADFKFNEKEWTYQGEAMFKDPWLLFPAIGQVTEEYPVPFYVNKENNHLLLLREPYGENTPYGDFFDQSKSGNILIDISDQEFVKAIWGIRAGNHKTSEGSEPIYCFNLESWDTDLMSYDKEYSKTRLFEADGRISNFNPLTNKIELFHTVHWVDVWSPTTWGWFPGLDDMAGYVILPDTYDSGFDAFVDKNSISSNVSVETGKGYVSISSASEVTVTIYSIGGSVIKTVEISETPSKVELLPGVYLVAGKKVMVF